MVGLYDLLPLILRVRDSEASGGGGVTPILQRIVGTVEDETEAMRLLITGMRDLLNPLLTTDLILALLAQQLGVTEFPFSEVESEPRQYVRDLVDSHSIKGTILSIIRESKARSINSGVFIHELWKTAVNAVDEYIADEVDVAYPDSAYKAARVVYVEGDGSETVIPSDGLTPGVFVDAQVPYSEAKEWRERLNNVFPIHVLLPVPTIRTPLEDENGEIDDGVGGKVYVVFRDEYRVEGDALTVTTQCVSGCQLSCQDRCEALCELTCETTCETSCQAQCEADCQATCQSFCQQSCELGCQDPCQSLCQQSCEAVCESGCESACQQNCQNGCQAANESCQSFCEMNCQTPREVACGDACQVACQSNAQTPCGNSGPATT